MNGRRAMRPTRGGAAKRERHRIIGELVAARPVRNQQELVELLAERGFEITQATVSRDIGELGLIKLGYAGEHIYASPQDVMSAAQPASDERLRRILADYPISLGRSGLTLLVVSEAGTADAIAQAIDESTLDDQEGTLAGDNTVLVLFADDERLDAWRARFEALMPAGSVNGPAR